MAGDANGAVYMAYNWSSSGYVARYRSQGTPALQRSVDEPR